MNIKKLIREEIKKLNEEVESDLVLPKGKRIVLQADNPKVDRGLIVTWLEDGGYNVEYWYKDPSKIYPAEVIIDGKPITTNGKVVHLGYHPELDEGFGGELSKTEKKKFNKERLENAEVLGYELTGTKDIKEGFASNAQRRAAFASGYKAKGKKNKKESTIQKFESKGGCLCEKCWKGYKIHPTRKTKILFGKRYPNCIKNESVNESKKEKDQIIKYLQGLGFDERTAKNAVAKSYNYISKAYRNTGTRYKGDLIARILKKNESVFAVNLDKEKDNERYPEQPNFNYDPEKGKTRIRKTRKWLS